MAVGGSISDRSEEMTRWLGESRRKGHTVVVVDNLCKLVRDPHEAAKFLPELTPAVERIEKGASFPEVREHAPAVSLWRSLGFVVVGTVPGAFHHPDHGYVGLHVMFLDLVGV